MYVIEKLDKASIEYNAHMLDEDIVVEFDSYKIEFFDEGIIIGGDDLELGYYLNEFEKENEYLSSFERDFDLVVSGRYPPNLRGFINKIFAIHYNPDPFKKKISQFLLFFIALVFLSLVVFALRR